MVGAFELKARAARRPEARAELGRHEAARASHRSHVPELPEVESLVRDLVADARRAARIQGVEIHKPKLFTATPGLTVEDLLGRRVETLVAARQADRLGAVGRAGPGRAPQAGRPDRARRRAMATSWPTAATRCRCGARRCRTSRPTSCFCLDDGSIVYLTDIRQFARLHLMPDDDVAAFLKHQKLGAEPLTRRFTAQQFGASCRRRGIPLKTAIMDQSVVGGIGNIYADESLWRAPTAPAARRGVTLTRRRGRALASGDSRGARLRRARRRGVRAAWQGHLRSRLSVLPRPRRFALPALPAPSFRRSGSAGAERTTARSARRRRASQRGCLSYPRSRLRRAVLRARIVGLRVRRVGGVDWPRMLPQTSEAELNGVLSGLTGQRRRSARASTCWSGWPTTAGWESIAR